MYLVIDLTPFGETVGVHRAEAQLYIQGIGLVSSLADIGIVNSDLSVDIEIYEIDDEADTFSDSSEPGDGG